MTDVTPNQGEVWHGMRHHKEPVRRLEGWGDLAWCDVDGVSRVWWAPLSRVQALPLGARS